MQETFKTEDGKWTIAPERIGAIRDVPPSDDPMTETMGICETHGCVRMVGGRCVYCAIRPSEPPAKCR